MWYFLHATPAYSQGQDYGHGTVPMVRAAHGESISAYSWAFSSIFSCSGFLLFRISGHHIPRRGSVCRLHESMVLQTCRIASSRVPCIISISTCSGSWKMQVANMSCQFSMFLGIQFWIMVTNQLQSHLELSFLYFLFLFFPFFLFHLPKLWLKHGHGSQCCNCFIPNHWDDAIGLSKRTNSGWLDCNFALFKEQLPNKILRVIKI